MASTRTLAKSINMSFLQNNNKIIYVSLLVILSFFLFLDYIPGMHAYSAWVTPPVALFLGLSFALLCGQAHPKFNKKISKYLLQYSVVGLGFGMNLQASLASGKEGMEEPAAPAVCRWEMLGYPLMSVLGIRSEDLQNS
jgi:uncharacterized membrane protein YadS